MQVDAYFWNTAAIGNGGLFFEIDSEKRYLKFNQRIHLSRNHDG
jgi:hypothetical protein